MTKQTYQYKVMYKDKIYILNKIRIDKGIVYYNLFGQCDLFGGDNLYINSCYCGVVNE
jgi:hypothetical protein